MRILQICSTRDIGGGERHVADLCNTLAKRGHDVFAVVGPNAQITGALHDVPGDNIVEVPIRGSLDAMAAGRIAKIVRENRINIIHAHVARDYPLAALASRLSGGTPFVLTRHVLFPLNKLHRVLLGRAARVIAVSRAVAESIERRQIFDPKKIVTIHNGIDVERFRQNAAQPQAFEDIKTRYIVGTIGHIAPIKGLDLFVNTAALITRERSDVDFVIAGEDRSRDGRNRRELEGLISECGLDKRVHLLGWQHDVASLLQQLDIFVSAARSEPFGLVILEAMAAGVPVVATASEGAVEIIDDGVTGVLVPLGESSRMAMAIRELLDHRHKSESLAASAFATVSDRFSIETMVDATELVYRDAIEQ